MLSSEHFACGSQSSDGLRVRHAKVIEVVRVRATPCSAFCFEKKQCVNVGMQLDQVCDESGVEQGSEASQYKSQRQAQACAQHQEMQAVSI